MSTMPTLCALAGPLPEELRPFLDSAGDLRAGDAVGLEAQWILSQVSFGGDEHPEDEWSVSQIDEDSRTVGCSRCGDEEVESEYGVCSGCREL